MVIRSKHLFLDYTPSLNYYLKGPYKDSLNHGANFTGSFSYSKWSFTIGQSYSKSSNPLVETGAQTETQSLATPITATFHYSDKVFFEFTLTQQFQEAQQFGSFKQWSTMDWLNYRLSDKTSIGAGAGAGYTDYDQGPDTTYEQFQGRFDWRIGTKLNFTANGGVEIRQFKGIADSQSQVNPLFGITGRYQLFEATSFSVSANESVSASLFQSPLSKSTSFSASIGQRLLKHLQLTISGGHQTTEYQSAGRSTLPDRTDDTTFFSTSLGSTFLKKGTVSVSYQHSANASTGEGFSYNSNQYTAQIEYRF